MRPEELRALLAQLAHGEISLDAAYRTLEGWPFLQSGEACLDLQREVRRGLPEVVYCEGKRPEQVKEVFASLAPRQRFILGTRATPDHAEAVRQAVPAAEYDPVSRLLTAGEPPKPDQPGPIAIISAGVSDEAVALEAAGTLTAFGHPVVRVKDAGVAGLHRIFEHLDTLKEALVAIVVAGMDGALPSVVAGLVPTPVIAVPTSVGYGASFGGLSALLAMLNSCAGGVCVVNIDNGFGAAYAASLIAKKVRRE